MSTILDALKRLEDKALARDERSIPGAMRGRGKAAGKRWRRPVAAIVAGLSIVGAALVVYWGYGKWSGQGQVKNERPPVSAPKAPVMHAIPKKDRQPLPSRTPQARSNSVAKKNPRAGAAAPPPTATPGVPTRKPKKPLARNPKKSLEGEAVRKRPQPVTRSRRSASAESAAGSAKPRRATSPADVRPTRKKPEKPVREVSRSASLPARDPYANAERVSKDELKLQAISWSDLPSDRVTIINSRILREGQSVDGYAVIQIRPEHVILSKTQRYWKLGYDN